MIAFSKAIAEKSIKSQSSNFCPAINHPEESKLQVYGWEHKTYGNIYHFKTFFDLQMLPPYLPPTIPYDFWRPGQFAPGSSGKGRYSCWLIPAVSLYFRHGLNSHALMHSLSSGQHIT